MVLQGVEPIVVAHSFLIDCATIQRLCIAVVSMTGAREVFVVGPEALQILNRVKGHVLHLHKDKVVHVIGTRLCSERACVVVVRLIHALDPLSQ